MSRRMHRWQGRCAPHADFDMEQGRQATRVRGEHRARRRFATMPSGRSNTWNDRGSNVALGPTSAGAPKITWGGGALPAAGIADGIARGTPQRSTIGNGHDLFVGRYVTTVRVICRCPVPDGSHVASLHISARLPSGGHHTRARRGAPDRNRRP